MELMVHCGILSITDTDHAVYYGDSVALLAKMEGVTFVARGQECHKLWLANELEKDHEPNYAGLSIW